MGCPFSRHKSNQSRSDTFWDRYDSDSSNMAPMEVKTTRVHRYNQAPYYKTTISSPVPLKIAIQPRRLSIEVQQERGRSVSASLNTNKGRRNTHPYFLRPVPRSKITLECVKNERMSIPAGDRDHKEILQGVRNKLEEKLDLSKPSTLPVPQPRKKKIQVSSSEHSSENDDATGNMGDDEKATEF